MSEGINDAPVTRDVDINDAPGPQDDVEEVLAEEEDLEETARSLPEAGTDTDPGSMLNY